MLLSGYNSIPAETPSAASWNSFIFLFNNNEIPRVILLQRFVKYKSPFHQRINSLVSGKCICDLKLVIFRFISRRDNLRISCETVPGRMTQHLADHWSTLVQAMAWCRQATSHNPSYCRPISMPPYGDTRPHCKSSNGSMGLSRWNQMKPECI